jgi:alanine dehydrogenase
MIVGVPTEVKDNENPGRRTPQGVRELVHAATSWSCSPGAGDGSALPDADFHVRGAQVHPTPTAVFPPPADMIVKSRSRSPSEFARALFREGQNLFTYLHLAAEEALTHRSWRIARSLRGVR